MFKRTTKRRDSVSSEENDFTELYATLQFKVEYPTKLNQVLYNFEEENIAFIPFSNDGTILAISSTSLYKLCIVKDEDTCDNT